MTVTKVRKKQTASRKAKLVGLTMPEMAKLLKCHQGTLTVHERDDPELFEVEIKRALELKKVHES